MITSRTLTPAQQLLADNADIVVDHVKQIVQIIENSKTLPLEKRHINTAFLGNSPTGRLFHTSDALDETQLKDLTTLLENKLILNEYSQRFDSIEEPGDNPESIQAVKQLIIDHFFEPIEKSKAWQEFWREQSQKIEERNESSAEEIKNKIAGALSYRIQGLIIPKRVDYKQVHDKYQIITAITNNYWNPTAVNAELSKKAESAMRNGLLSIRDAIVSDEINSKKIPVSLEMRLNGLRKSSFYFSAPDGEKLLQEQLVATFLNEMKKEYENKNISKYTFKKTVEGILLDMKHNNLSHFITRNKKPGAHFMNTIKAIKDLNILGEKVSKECKGLLLAHTYHSNPHKSELKPAGGSTFFASMKKQKSRVPKTTLLEEAEPKNSHEPKKKR